MNVRVVTISYQLGTCGRAIAEQLADRLGFRLLDKEVLDDAARAAGIAPGVLSAAEHPVTLLDRIVAALAASPPIPVPAMYLPRAVEPTSPARIRQYRSLIDAVIKALPAQGQFVVLGHAGQAVLSNRWDTLKVLITGSKRLRALAIAEERGLTAEEALQLVDQADRAEAKYLREPPHGIHWLSPDLYDLCVNTDHISTGRAADLILAEAMSR